MAAADLQRVARPKPDELTAKVGASAIYESAIAYMDDVLDDCLRDIAAAEAYRDSLMVAFDTLTGVRRRTLTLTHSRHFRLDDDAFELFYEPHEVKTREAYEATLPSELSAYIERGFAVARFLSRHGDPPWKGDLWISREDKPFTERDVYRSICAMSESLVRIRLNPQRLRRLIPTSIQRFVPAESALASATLQHSKARTTRSNYNKAGPRSSIREYHRILDEPRRKVNGE